MSRHLWSCVALLLSSLALQASEPAPQQPTAVAVAPDLGASSLVQELGDGREGGCCLPEPFTAGALSLQFLAGSYPSNDWGPGTKKKFSYIDLVGRLGCTLHDPILDGTRSRGSFELLVEYHATPLTGDFGSYFTGPGLLLRYNWVQPDACVVPYTQFGCGIVFTDAYRDQQQRLIGQCQEFLLQAHAGLHCLLTPRLSLDLEGGYQHISNGGLADRNGGVNNVGVSIGLSILLP